MDRRAFIGGIARGLAPRHLPLAHGRTQPGICICLAGGKISAGASAKRERRSQKPVRGHHSSGTKFRPGEPARSASLLANAVLIWRKQRRRYSEFLRGFGRV